MDEEGILDFNFWPSFSDLMLALVLVLCLILFLVLTVITVGTVNLKQVQDNQMSMINSIAGTYKVQPKRLDDHTFAISSDNSNLYDIKIQNDLNQQRITFSDKILFLPDEVIINPKGQEVLTAVGHKLQNQLSSIKEVQIQGHADTNKTRYGLNTLLAAHRAIAVFEFFRTKVGIDPATHLMSATSFGEYRSVNRARTESPYNWQKILEDNSTDNLRSQNRRIELVLVYRQ